MSLLKLWFIRNPVLVSYSICMRHGSSNLSGSQSALACLCVCARAGLGLREFNNKADPKRVRLTVGGNLLHYPIKVSTPTADLSTVKLLLNSVISTPGARFATFDLKDFYLSTPMMRK
jgi:hypothetical protein